MCGVIGVKGKVDPSLIKQLFIETQIRGRHATGVSYWKDGKVNTIKEPIPAEEFVEKYDPADWFDGDTITMVGHCRYSTSDLEFNQPISNDERAVVHNGVITQEDPSVWAEMYGYNCEGKNDTELLFLSWDAEAWPDSSIAAIFLEDGDIKYTRNGKRPMWITIIDETVVVTSTKDIALRSGLNNPLKLDYEGRDLQ